MNYKDPIVVAIVTDYDETATAKTAQEYGFAEAINLPLSDYFDTVNFVALQNNSETTSVNLRLTMEYLKKNNKPVTRETFKELGKNVEYHPGVLDFYKNIKEFGKQHNIIIYNFVVSSNIKPLIEGGKLNKYIDYTFANDYIYNDKTGEAFWPAHIVGFSEKPACLYRISKGVYKLNDPSFIHYRDEEDRDIPFKNIIYLGDSKFDLPALRLVKSKGGTAIGVFSPHKENSAQIQAYLEKGKISNYLPADYHEGSELNNYIKNAILKIKQRYDEKQDEIIK